MSPPCRDDADPVERACGRQSAETVVVLPAHAMPDAADWARLELVLRVEIGEQRQDIVDNARVRRMVHRGPNYAHHPIVAARNIEAAGASR